MREDAAAVVREMLKGANVYVLAHVIDDIGEATVRGALEAGALVGLGAGQIPPYRVLFCSTLDGKVSIVRQLEPDLHVDGHPQTVRQSDASKSSLRIWPCSAVLCMKGQEKDAFPAGLGYAVLDHAAIWVVGTSGVL